MDTHRVSIWFTAAVTVFILHSTSRAFTEYDGNIDIPNPDRGSAPTCGYHTPYSTWDDQKNDVYWDGSSLEETYLHISPYPVNNYVCGESNPFSDSEDPSGASKSRPMMAIA